MNFPSYWRETRSRLDQELRCQIPILFSTLPPLQIETVQQIIRDGKHIRGCLVCLINNALGGKTEDALPRAIAIECIQAASLIHDDYVDEDVTRRQRPATWTVEGPRRAVLLGDVMFATAIQSMAELGNEDGAIVARAIATVANGAYQELSWQTDGGGANLFEAGIYDRIIYLKTGALFGAACQLGAIATGASQEISTLAYAFGTRTGEAYQIADDLQDFITLWEHPQEGFKKLSPLLPALNYFCHRMGLALPHHASHQQRALHEWCQRIGEDFINCMEQEISLRLKQAESYIEYLPDNPYTKMLSKAPAKIATMMYCSTLPPGTAYQIL
ncbi:polyprenyl synthetase family protein [Nitrosococcus wardiae]|uniref:Polyprenyl synthetase family protein n=1 Tax=Nitrosococcus wardiae TaxID=1814290 RepID=A0A4P7BWL8_9GAMM|nr:polyprenyl synthetase family protein [Nitrosococcus wardiae]QBQ53490.1 polyprenyl synthetase family protein [Nitrosococcus wardiae]